MDTMDRPLEIRPARPEESPAIAAIYNEGIASRQATFETRLRTPADIQPWFNNPLHPLLVACSPNGYVLGWVHASSYRDRECYAGIGEFSIYIATNQHGRGVGSRLMAAFIPACATAGLWKLLSRIFVENTASRALCVRHGFREVGVYYKHAQLDGQWRDVVIVERLLP